MRVCLHACSTPSFPTNVLWNKKIGPLDAQVKMVMNDTEVHGFLIEYVDCFMILT